MLLHWHSLAAYDSVPPAAAVLTSTNIGQIQRQCKNFMHTYPQPILWWVCLSVRLSACTSWKPHGWTSPNFCVCCLWSWPDPSLTAMHYVTEFAKYVPNTFKMTCRSAFLNLFAPHSIFIISPNISKDTLLYSTHNSMQWNIALFAINVCHVDNSPCASLTCWHYAQDRQWMDLHHVNVLNKKHLKNVGPIPNCEPPHAHSQGVATVARTHRCPRQRQQRVTEGTAMAPWNGPKDRVLLSNAPPY